MSYLLYPLFYHVHDASMSLTHFITITIIADIVAIVIIIIIGVVIVGAMGAKHFDAILNTDIHRLLIGVVSQYVCVTKMATILRRRLSLQSLGRSDTISYSNNSCSAICIGVFVQHQNIVDHILVIVMVYCSFCRHARYGCIWT